MSSILVSGAVTDHAAAWETTDWSAAGTSGSGSGSPHWTTATTGIMNGLTGLGMAFASVWGTVKNPGAPNHYMGGHPPIEPPRRNNTVLYLGIALVAIVLFLVFKKK